MSLGLATQPSLFSLSRSRVRLRRSRQLKSPTTRAPLSSVNWGRPRCRATNYLPASSMTSSEAKFPAVFVDRDGTIMHDALYCSDPKQVHVFEDVPAALRQLKANGYKLIIITNQSGIGRGFFTVDQYRAVEAEVLRQLGDNLIDGTYFCP